SDSTALAPLRGRVYTNLRRFRKSAADRGLRFGLHSSLQPLGFLAHRLLAGPRVPLRGHNRGVADCETGETGVSGRRRHARLRRHEILAERALLHRSRSRALRACASGGGFWNVSELARTDVPQTPLAIRT